ncbi:tRNA dimethylallyltransferase 2 [Senna tora]|uniref:tRNA dimethylallyltransferase 2 n=1 Tax=Senna tora TaxID=362788 RepID=A0A834WL30_9FABA|nr:tRNA dimethylallyltransferase 2 [Senna tora]
MDDYSGTDAIAETHGTPNPNYGGQEKKPKVVVIMGPTGSGKSKLAIDLASQFPIEVINADSMQVYRGLDVLTNKVPLSDQNGVPHHLLGTVSPNVEFTAKEFRDSAIPLIDVILARNCLPVLVGGGLWDLFSLDYVYIVKALVSPFLLDDSVEDMDETCLSDLPGITELDKSFIPGKDTSSNNYDLLKDIDPVAANRMHPNNHRKISQYLSLYARTGVLPSTMFQGKAAENWGQVDNLRYDCCFICVDASLPVLDRYVEQRVDCMMDAGLLNEVYDIYNLNADYTRGLRQAIGVREFEPLLKTCVIEDIYKREKELTEVSVRGKGNKLFDDDLRELLKLSSDTKSIMLLEEAVEKVKVNTRRLVRRQKRMVNRLQKLFDWTIHFVDSTESLSSKSDDIWKEQVVEPAVSIVRSFLSKNENLSPTFGMSNSSGMKIIQRDLWTQYVCKACGDKVLRGLHEWEQHKEGRSHQKRISSLKNKSPRLGFPAKHPPPPFRHSFSSNIHSVQSRFYHLVCDASFGWSFYGGCSGGRCELWLELRWRLGFECVNGGDGDQGVDRWRWAVGDCDASFGWSFHGGWGLNVHK